MSTWRGLSRSNPWPCTNKAPAAQDTGSRRFIKAPERAPNGIYLKWTRGLYESAALMVGIGVNKDVLQLCLYQAGLLFR